MRYLRPSRIFLSIDYRRFHYQKQYDMQTRVLIQGYYLLSVIHQSRQAYESCSANAVSNNSFTEACVLPNSSISLRRAGLSEDKYL